MPKSSSNDAPELSSNGQYIEFVIQISFYCKICVRYISIYLNQSEFICYTYKSLSHKGYLLVGD